MKRSEMISKITDIVMDSISEPITLAEADLILTKLEEAGMAPPEYQSDIYIRSECDFAMVHEWESEDKEQKNG